MSGTRPSFTTSDDVLIAYDDEGHGRPVVMLHGYSSRKEHWEYQREALLDAGHRVIGVDLRGHGASETPEHGLTVARLGQDVRELIAQLDLHDVTLLCHSMGCSVALAMHTISGFDRVGRFVYVDQSPKIINDDDWSWGVKGVTWKNVDDCINWRIEWINEDQEPALPPESTMAQEPWQLFDHLAVRNLLIDHFVSDWRSTLPRVAVPTWVVTSLFTSYYDVEGMQWVADQLPDSRLSVFEHSGHNIFVSEAERFNAELLEFIATT